MLPPNGLAVGFIGVSISHTWVGSKVKELFLEKFRGYMHAGKALLNKLSKRRREDVQLLLCFFTVRLKSHLTETPVQKVYL